MSGEDVEVIESGAPDPSQPVFATSADAQRLVGEWLAAWANGKTKDQNTVLLDRIVRDRVAAVPKTTSRRPVNIEGEISAFIDRFIGGLVPADSPIGQRLTEHIADMIAQHSAPAMIDAPESGALMHDAEILTALEERINEMTGKVEMAIVECTRAHDWRFHLESGAREALKTLNHLLNVVKRAPSREEMEGVIATLKEAVGWTP